MNDEKDSSGGVGGQAGRDAHSTDVVCQFFGKHEFQFDQTDGYLRTGLYGDHVDLDILVITNDVDPVTIVARLPVRATPDFRSAVGEFLHRLNFKAPRKLWEIDHNNGEIRVALYIDTTLGPLTVDVFESLFHLLVVSADAVFPYLTSVLSGRLKPDFAADQAEAATAA